MSKKRDSVALFEVLGKGKTERGDSAFHGEVSKGLHDGRPPAHDDEQTRERGEESSGHEEQRGNPAVDGQSKVWPASSKPAESTDFGRNDLKNGIAKKQSWQKIFC